MKLPCRVAIVFPPFVHQLPRCPLVCASHHIHTAEEPCPRLGMRAADRLSREGTKAHLAALRPRHGIGTVIHRGLAIKRVGCKPVALHTGNDKAAILRPWPARINGLQYTVCVHHIRRVIGHEDHIVPSVAP